MCAHIADIQTLPADFLFLPEVSLTAVAQRHATKELAQGERGSTTVWGASQPPRESTKGVLSQWDSLPGGVGAAARKPAGIQKIALPIPREVSVRQGEPDLVEEGRLFHVALRELGGQS